MTQCFNFCKRAESWFSSTLIVNRDSCRHPSDGQCHVDERQILLRRALLLWFWSWESLLKSAWYFVSRRTTWFLLILQDANSYKGDFFLSVNNIYIRYNIWTVGEKDFKFLDCILNWWCPFKWSQGQWPCDLDFDLYAKKSFLDFVATGDILFHKHRYFYD